MILDFGFWIYLPLVCGYNLEIKVEHGFAPTVQARRS
jgi:hypothetical protein